MSIKTCNLITTNSTSDKHYTDILEVNTKSSIPTKNEATQISLQKKRNQNLDLCTKFSIV